ncbi:hypothetical protein, partial [Actinocorallia lasiicapitis]
MTADALYLELRRLTRGRGLRTAELDRLAPWLPGDRAQVTEALHRGVAGLPADLRLVALAVLGLHPETEERFLGQRISWLSDRLDRDARTVRRRVDEAFRLLSSGLLPHAPDTAPFDRLRLPFLAGTVTVEARPMELLTGIDVLVSPGNTHLEQPQTYKSSTSAALRRAAAHHGPAGEITDDVLQRGLTAWTAAHSRVGLEVAPGTVVPLAARALET